MRVPTAWQEPITQGRLLVLSPFPSKHRRPTIALAEQRNRLVADVAQPVFVAHASPDSKTEAFCRKLIEQGRVPWTFDSRTNAALQSLGARCFSSDQAVVQALGM